MRAVTLEPEISGVPTCTAPSADVSNISEKVISLPTSPGSNSTRKSSPGETLYCFPPVRMTAYDIFFTYVRNRSLSTPKKTNKLGARRKSPTYRLRHSHRPSLITNEDRGHRATNTQSLLTKNLQREGDRGRTYPFRTDMHSEFIISIKRDMESRRD